MKHGNLREHSHHRGHNHHRHIRQEGDIPGAEKVFIEIVVIPYADHLSNNL